MICACGDEATTYRIADPLHGLPMEIHRCHHCKRHRDEAGRWLRMGGYCDGCDCRTWRTVVHPKHGHEIMLWPIPTTIFAFVATPDGPGVAAIRDYCPDCCPAVGATPSFQCEAGGDPVVTGAVLRHETAVIRHPFQFSDAYGAWLRLWVFDGLHLDAGAGNAVIDQWTQDRAAALA